LLRKLDIRIDKNFEIYPHQIKEKGDFGVGVYLHKEIRRLRIKFGSDKTIYRKGE